MANRKRSAQAADHGGAFWLITIPFSAHRLARYEMGDLVVRAASGTPRIAEIAVSN